MQEIGSPPPGRGSWRKRTRRRVHSNCQIATSCSLTATATTQTSPRLTSDASNVTPGAKQPAAQRCLGKSYGQIPETWFLQEAGFLLEFQWNSIPARHSPQFDTSILVGTAFAWKLCKLLVTEPQANSFLWRRFVEIYLFQRAVAAVVRNV